MEVLKDFEFGNAVGYGGWREGGVSGMEVVMRVKGLLASREEGEVIVYPGPRHGFATRGDDKVGVERRQAEEMRE